MELWSRADPQLREVVWFSVRCRALALLLQASLSSLLSGLLLSGFSPHEIHELVLHKGEILSGEPTDRLQPRVLLAGCC